MEGDGGRRETRIACRTVDFLPGTHRDAQSLGRGVKEAGGRGSTRQCRSGPKTNRRSALEGGSPGLGTSTVGRAPLLLGTGGLKLFPGFFRQQGQIVEFAGATQPLAPVDHHALSVDVLRHVAQEKGSEVRQFFMLSEALHGMFADGVFFKLLRRNEPRPSALSGKRAGGDGVYANMIFRPFNGEGGRHRENAGLGAGRGHHEAGATVGRGVGGGDVEDSAAEFLGEALFCEHLRAVKRAVENNADNSVEGVGGKLLGARHEIAGGVVDQGIDFAKVAFSGSEGQFDGSVVADIAGRKSRRTTAFMNFVANVLERLLAAADEKEPGPQLHEMEGHRAAQAGAASGKKNGTTFQQIRLKHDRKTAFPGARSIVAAVGESGPGKRGTSGGCAIPPSTGRKQRAKAGRSLPRTGQNGETLPTGHIAVGRKQARG